MPIGLCLYTTKKYHILEDTISIESIYNCNKNCWFVLGELQKDFRHQKRILSPIYKN